MPTYNISINDELDVIVQQEMKRGKYANRSEYFRDLLRKTHIMNDYVVESVNETDSDYQFALERKKNGQFVSLEQLKKQLDV